MSVQLLRRILALVSTAGAAILILTAVVFGTQQSPAERIEDWPSFTIPRGLTRGFEPAGQTEFVSSALGEWWDPAAEAREVESAEKREERRVRMADLGKVVAVVAMRALRTDSLRSSIAFETASGEVRTLTVGEAIETDAHPRFGAHVQVASRYKLIVCEADSKDGASTRLCFDMECDGTDLQDLRWRCLDDSTPLGVVIPEREFLRWCDADPGG